jgi:hypothetical protein
LAFQPYPFEVECPCGQRIQGLRQRRHQRLECPACHAPVFILPRSPLPPVIGPGESAAPAPRVPHARASAGAWLAPLLAAGSTLLVVVAAFVVLLPYLRRHPPPPPGDGPPDPRTLAARTEAGKQALAAGNFQRARQELDAAAQAADQFPNLLTPAERRALDQLRRQAALLADLFTEPLEQVLQHAAGLPAEEWRAVFDRRYHGKAVVFDAQVRKDPASGRLELLGYRLLVGPAENREEAVLELNDVKRLGQLPLDQPRRLLFGVRLASAGREPGGRLGVRFQPESGVLLTDPGAVAACGLTADADLPALLRQQLEWVEELSAAAPRD